MKDHDGCRRAFIWSSKAWYATRDEPQEIMFGMYNPEGGTSGEMIMRWKELDGRKVPQLQVFDDAWSALALFTDLIRELGEKDDENITPEQFVEILLNCGFMDNTAYKSEARAELAEKVVYKSDDGLLWAIRHGSIGSTSAAYEKGAKLVLFEGEPIEVGARTIMLEGEPIKAEGGTTYPIGIMRAGKWAEPHIGELIEDITANLDNNKTGINDELSMWFCHPAGFFAGRGTAKAPCFKPVKINLATLANAIDTAWLR